MAARADLDGHELEDLHRYWQAANYLTVGQIYLQANAMLREPLRPDHIKPRLLGHWGTSPGLSLLYGHLNRLIRIYGAQVLLVTGPGHGGPAILANLYLEGSYSATYPEISRDETGMLRLFRQFSTPGGVPSHVGAATPGSIHEGGELGYSLSHAFGAAFDNPELLVACVIGDGEAETGPLEGAWKGVHFLNPVRDGAVLPILHLNGYKISGPTVLARTTDDDIGRLLHGHGYDVRFVEGHEPYQVHRDLAAALDACYLRIREIQQSARSAASVVRPRWPAIVLRTPKGWTGPARVDGQQVEGTFRAHQVPLPHVRENASHLAQLEGWMHSYLPRELFDHGGRLVPELGALAPDASHRMGSNPHANGGAISQPLRLPESRSYAIDVVTPGTVQAESTRKLGELLRDVFTENRAASNFRVFCPDETRSNRLDALFEVEHRLTLDPILPTDDRESTDGRVLEVLSEHNCEGWLEGYVLTGRHGLFATYEAFAMISVSMTIQHAKWLEATSALPWRDPIASLNLLLTSTCWRNDHNGFSHQGPGFIDALLSMRGTVVRVYLPPDANTLLCVAEHCLRSREYVNLIVIDKQPELQWLDYDDAVIHCEQGISIWDWAGTHTSREPDVVLCCAGDTATLETLAAASLLRQWLPSLAVRVVNIVDLMRLFPSEIHPHGLGDDDFARIFTFDTDVVLAFHGYPGAVHDILHGRRSAERFHVRGYREQGTTTTPFDMVVLNGMSRFHLVQEAVRRARGQHEASGLLDYCASKLEEHSRYVREYFEDMPEIREWRWDPR